MSDKTSKGAANECQWLLISQTKTIVVHSDYNCFALASNVLIRSDAAMESFSHFSPSLTSLKGIRLRFCLTQYSSKPLPLITIFLDFICFCHIFIFISLVLTLERNCLNICTERTNVSKTCVWLGGHPLVARLSSRLLSSVCTPMAFIFRSRHS